MSAQRHLLGSVAGVAFAAGLIAPANAQEEVAPINSGNVSFSVGFDVYTEYWFRGIDQGTAQKQGIQFQPYVDVAFDLWSYEDFSLGYYFGSWNSFSTADGSGDDPTDGDGGWYESDIYTGFSVGLPMNFAIDFGYTLLYSPQGGTTFAQEIYAGASYDDSGFWADNGMDAWSFGGFQPYVYFAVEVEGSSDGGSSDGTYAEVGIEPGFELPFSPQDYPISFSIPVAAGFSLDDYYESDPDGDGDFDDETFGFASIGLQFGVPLPFIPAEYGAWEATTGVTFLFLSDGAQDISDGVSGDGEDVHFIGNFGISMSY